VQQIVHANGMIQIGGLSKQLYISQDAFEKRFRQAVGTTAKQFSSIVRLRHVIDNFSSARSLTDLAYSAGYFDQAHFTKDFSVFTGRAPRQFFADGRFW
jgi:AraC-like DNA-binding protein